MAETVLACEGLRYNSDGFELFGGLSFDLALGETGVVLSDPQLRSRRLLQLCSTVRRPAAGTVRWFGKEPENWASEQLLDIRRRIGYIHRESRLVSNMTILDNIVLGLVYHRNIPHREAEAMISETLHRFGLLEYRNWRPSEVSYAMQRRALYLRELAKKPRLFLLEVPQLDLDQDFEEMIDVIGELVKKGEAALMLSDLRGNRVVEIADWVMTIDDGGAQLQSADEFDRAEYVRFLDHCRREPVGGM